MRGPTLAANLLRSNHSPPRSLATPLSPPPPLPASVWAARNRLRSAALAGDPEALIQAAKDMGGSSIAPDNYSLLVGCRQPKSRLALLAMIDRLGWSAETRISSRLFAGAIQPSYSRFLGERIPLALIALAYGNWDGALFLESRSDPSLLASFPGAIALIARGAGLCSSGAQAAAARALALRCDPQSSLSVLECNALHISAQLSPSFLPYFLSLGANPNAIDALGHTPLSLAAMRADPSSCLTLMAAGSDPTLPLGADAAERERKLTPLHLLFAAFAKDWAYGDPQKLALACAPAMDAFEDAGLSFSKSLALDDSNQWLSPRDFLLRNRREEFIIAFETRREALSLEARLASPAKPSGGARRAGL